MKKQKQAHSLNSNNGFVIIAVSFGLILLTGIFCYTWLEIVPSTRWEGPSREVRANQYFALEKWLRESDRPLRTLSEGNMDTILKGPEKIIFVEASRFTWNKDLEMLIPWLREGNRLIISLDTYLNYRLKDFMGLLGLKTLNYDDNEENAFISETKLSEEGSGEHENPAENIYFDSEISFIKSETEESIAHEIYVINQYGKTKLVKYKIGKGELIFTGKANFLKNYSLRLNGNAKLASLLFFDEIPSLTPHESGVLFIRSLSGNRHLFGNIAERGNPLAMLVSAVLLVIIGGWMVIPVFGRYKTTAEKPGKPLRERFLAEGRFLKKNHALGKYIETYEKETEQRKRSRGLPYTSEASFGDSADREWSGTFNQFLRRQKTLIEQLEQLEK